jgi:hypothetical protein
MSKFSALFIATLGLYSFYWFYKHWQLLGRSQDRNLLPILRAIFPLFFISSLCNELAKAERQKDQHYRWNPQALAVSFIVLQVIAFVLYFLAYNQKIAPGWHALQFLIFFGYYYLLYKFQLVANRVCDDPFGSQNSTYSFTNHAWIVFGIIHWLDQLRTLYLLITGQISL